MVSTLDRIAVACVAEYVGCSLFCQVLSFVLACSAASEAKGGEANDPRSGFSLAPQAFPVFYLLHASHRGVVSNSPPVP